MANSDKVSASFRDPSGFLFRREGILYRQVNQSYRANYERLMESGLYEKLVNSGALIRHQEVELKLESSGLPETTVVAYKIIQPELIPFISYPYEWSFSQLKAAALLTLKVQKAALDNGMSLKDASAYNIQFKGYKPVLIDTLSFEIYQEGEPWVAYRQFCQHFLAPLALMALRDVRLNQLLRIYIDGVPLDLASKMLPAKTRFNFSIATHIHLHASAQQRYADKAVKKETLTGKMSKISFLGLLDSLETLIRKLAWKPAGTEWGSYYTETNYSEKALEHKRQVVKDFLDTVHPEKVWDLGANTGLFSRLACDQGAFTLAFDIDPAAVDLNYQEAARKKETLILPLVLDLTNPSPSLGWQNKERNSLMERGPADAVMALALIHHLAISNNVPLESLADFLASIAPWLIIEFVPKTDTQVERLLASREDIFPDYDQKGFEQAFRKNFSIRKFMPVQDSERLLYLMERLG
jgi:ribosomal protein L11 methylase PrmA